MKLVPFGQAGALLRLELAEAEEGVSVEVRDPTGAEVPVRIEHVLESGAVLDVLLPRKSGAAETVESAAAGHFPGGLWSFVVRDRALNRSRVFEEALEFRSRDIALEWSLVEGSPRSARLVADRLLVTDGGACALQLRCNEFYTLTGARLQSVADEALLGDEVQIETREAGAATLSCRPLRAGNYRLTCELRGSGQASLDIVEEELEVVAIPNPLVLQVPDAGGARFLSDLEDVSLLRREPGPSGVGGRVTSGAGWGLTPPDRRLLRGRYWLARGEGQPVPLERIGASAEGGLLPSFDLGRGQHTLFAELEDVLGRAVDVRSSTGPLVATETLDVPAVELCSFYFHDQPASLLRAEIPVERNVPARLEVLTPLPLHADDDALLLVGNAKLRRERRIDDPDLGLRYVFMLPPDEVQRAPGLTDLSPEEWASGRTSELPATFVTPATSRADATIVLPLRTTRTTLSGATLGELFPERAIPDPLAGLRMVPFLGGDEPFVDPVPEDTPGPSAVQAASTCRGPWHCGLLPASTGVDGLRV